jgi:hypothetical protein
MLTDFLVLNCVNPFSEAEKIGKRRSIQILVNSHNAKLNFGMRMQNLPFDYLLEH